jgi:hypothetical protein
MIAVPICIIHFLICLCTNVMSISAAYTENGWELYLFNGPGQFKGDLQYGVNPNGYGDISTLPTSGGHKMSEAVFNARQYTQVQARGSDGASVTVQKVGGGVFYASEVFAVNPINGIYMTREDTGQRYQDGHSTMSSHGPLYTDPFGMAYGWMWTAVDGRKGRVYGHSSSDTSYTWAWFALVPSDPLASPLDIRPDSHPQSRLDSQRLGLWFCHPTPRMSGSWGRCALCGGSRETAVSR